MHLQDDNLLGSYGFRIADLQLQVMDNLSKYTLSSFIIEEPNLDTSTLNKRYTQLNKIQSHHFFTIRSINSSNLINTVDLIYKNQEFITLADYTKSRELLPSQIKSIIWQVTKLMVECERLKINHLRLSTKTIVAAKTESLVGNSQSKSKNPFIWVRDFSFGKQFSEVSVGKKLQIFQFLHPRLSIENGPISFKPNFYDSQLDIWSFGIVLYYLIYKLSPFRKEGREIFSKTILRQFLNKQYQISFHNKKYASINDIIEKCLKSQLKEWRHLQKLMINQEQIYNEIDFMLSPFHQFCINHITIMYLFSSIHEMISQQIQKSTHPFWKMRIQNRNVPFVLLTEEYVLLLISNTHKRFLSLYHSHFIVLQKNNRSQMIDQLDAITKSIQNQIKNINKSWLIPKLFGKEETSISLQIIQQMQLNFANIILKTGINRKSVRQTGQKDKSNEQKSFLKASQFRRMGGWRSLQILFDFCDQMISIFNGTKNHMKLLYQHIYSSKILNDMAIFDFKFTFQ